MKKCFAVFVFICVLLARSGFADTENVNGITWTYKISNCEASVGGGGWHLPAVPSSTTGTVSIPESLGGYPVTSLGFAAFDRCSNITSVRIPESVRTIGFGAFNQCGKLESVELPNGLSEIPDQMFYDCVALQSVSIPTSVTNIGQRAFSGCSRLMSITIPNSMMRIEGEAFYGCPSQMVVRISDLDAWCKISRDSNPFYTPYRLVLNDEEVHNLIIPDSVTSIGDSAFIYCCSLTAVTIPDSVTSIGDRAFSGCSGLTSVTIPDSVTNIGAYAFSGCSGLSSIVIPDSVTRIGTSAFSDCSSTICDTITFPGLKLVDGWVVEADRSLSGDIDLNGIRGIGGTPFQYLSRITAVTLPNTMTSIGDCAFDGCSRLKSVTIPDSVTSIGDSAFGSCSSLTSATIPSSVTNIGHHAFYSSGLTSVTIPDSVMRIGEAAFSCCRDLTSVTIGNGLTDIGEQAFRGCSILASFYMESTNRNFVISDGLLLSKNGKTLIAGINGTVVIPNGVTTIGDYAFDARSSLTSVEIPDSVTSIGDSAFSGCRGLTSVTIPESVTRIGNFAFDGCISLVSVTIPEGIASIGGCAFQNCSALTSVTIPDSVRSIGSYAFNECNPSLYDMTTLPGLKLVDGWVVESDSSLSGELDLTGIRGIAGSAFYGCGALTTVTIPSGVQTIGAHAFANCSVLASVTISNGVTSIGDGAFNCCPRLTSVDIPNSVTTIGREAFAFSGLMSMTIPDGVSSIGEEAFYVCSYLKSVTIPDSVTNIGNDAFNECYRLILAVLPESFCGRTDELGIRKGCEIRVFRNPIDAAGNGSGLFIRFTDDISVPWIVAEEESATDGFCLRSGEIPANTNSAIEATISGKGTLSFKWKVPAGRGDYARVYLDGEVQKSIQRVTAWQTVSLDIPAGEHTVRWSYERGSGSATGEDAEFLDDVDWRPEVSLSVASAFGTMTPDAGTHTFVYGDEVVASAVAPEPENGTRRVCTGWRGTGSAPASGAESGVLFTITNETSIVWNWRTDYLTGVSVSGGSGGFESQWVASGETIDVALSPTAHLYEISLSGDTEGVTLDGTTLRFVADKPRQIDVTITEVKVSLAVDSEYGVPSPTNGVHDLSWGTQVSATIAEPEPTNGVQYVCTGWTGMGSVPESGTGTNMAFTIESDSSIQWNWQTNVWISVAANGPVGVDVADGWFALGETVVAHYSPNVDFFTLALSGDTDGVVLDESARTIAISADRPRSVTLSVAELTLKSALDAGKLSWETSGSATWFPQVAVSADGISSARSGSLSGGDDVSALETTVQGGGTFAWSWRLGVSGDSNSGVDVLLDGEWLDAYYPGTDWSRETLEITEDGTHTIRFEFWNAGTETGDCAYLDQVSWSGGVPSHGIVIGDVRIPSDWIDENAASALAKANGDYETAANAMAANEINKVWECYVAGISPTNETARFEATIEVVDGKPIVRWNPLLSAEEEAKRIRKVLGKRSLDDPDGWQDMANIDDIDAAGYRFFKVSVEMK